MNTPVSISIVIPTVNQVEPVIKCLDTLFATVEGRDVEVVVIDDGSSTSLQKVLEDKVLKYPVRFIGKKENTGFARTVNLGVTACQGRYICLVNNDVVFTQKKWLDKMIATMESAGTGVVGARLLYPDGRIQHAGIYYLPEGRTFDHQYRYKPGRYGHALKSYDVLGVTGALMMVDRTLWKSLGGMDENFFVGLEDVDFSLRTWKSGKKVRYCGMAEAIHYEGLTRGNTMDNKDPYWLHKEMEGMEYFFCKWSVFLYRLGGYATNARMKNPGVNRSQRQAERFRRITAKR